LLDPTKNNPGLTFAPIDDRLKRPPDFIEFYVQPNGFLGNRRRREPGVLPAMQKLARIRIPCHPFFTRRTNAGREAPGGRAGIRRKILTWIRRNPLKSPDSDE
jgi:hypothetical protein